MNLDIATTVTVAFVILLAFVLIFLLSGIRSIRAGQKLFFFRKRRELTCVDGG
jgi:regulator of protease activity HflC (stomatin/prohibitin superfamily)